MEGRSALMKWQESGLTNPLESRTELFEAALDAFSALSFGETSLNEIIKKAGMNKGSFYYWFHDKMDLYLSLLHYMGMEKLEVFRQQDAAVTSGEFFDSFRAKALLGLRFAQKEPRYNSLWRKVMVEDASVRHTIRECFGDITQNVLTGMIDKAKAAGEIKTDISTQMAASVFSTLLEQIDLMISPDMNDQDILARVDELIGVMKFGMAAPAISVQKDKK